jgi:pSer/pThr/pTyr-binding forkhead associated (FHA) protein
LTTSQTLVLDTPTLAESAPQVNLLVNPSSPQAKRIPCRHVVTLLGSRAGCKIVIPNRRISPVHLALVHTGQSIYAVDLLTPQGTFLNGLRMQYEKVSQGDSLSIESWNFRVQIEEPGGSGNGDVHPFGLEPTPQVIALEHLASRRVLCPSREVCLVGRRAGCDITLSDQSVSRVHALLFTYFGYPYLVDLLSRNHTLVNDEPVGFQVLKNDDVVTLGEARFRVRLMSSRAGDRPAKPADSPLAPIKLEEEESESADLVDIQATEGSQRWRIAEHFEKNARHAAAG